MSFARQKQEIIYWAGVLNQKGLVTARNGNISCKVGEEKILITAHGAYLGRLQEQEILLADVAGNILEGDATLTSEKNLHLDIQRLFKILAHGYDTVVS